MKKRILLILVIGFLMSACGTTAEPEPTPKHPLLEGLEPPPVNMPIKSSPIRAEEVKPRLPEDDLPALLVTLNDQPFTGTLRETGAIRISAEVIDVRLESGDHLSILYRTPKGMAALTADTEKALVEIAEFSDPVAANRSVMISDERTSIFAEVWQSSAKPLTFEFGKAIRLAQRETKPSQEEGGYTEVELQVFEGDELLATLPIGEPSDIKTSEGTFQVFVEVSHLFTPNDQKLNQYPQSYILHVWIVGLR